MTNLKSFQEFYSINIKYFFLEDFENYFEILYNNLFYSNFILNFKLFKRKRIISDIEYTRYWHLFSNMSYFKIKKNVVKKFPKITPDLKWKFHNNNVEHINVLSTPDWGIKNIHPKIIDRQKKMASSKNITLLEKILSKIKFPHNEFNVTVDSERDVDPIFDMIMSVLIFYCISISFFYIIKVFAEKMIIIILSTCVILYYTKDFFYFKINNIKNILFDNIFLYTINNKKY